MKNKKILVTGGAGFIGRNLVRKLSHNNDTIVLDLKKSTHQQSIIADVRKTDWFAKVGTVDYIFHLAAIVGVDYVSQHPDETVDTELKGINNVITFARQYDVAKIIYASTSGVYETADHPTCYNTAKLDAENLLKSSGIDHAIVRFFNIYGKYQDKKMVIPRFVDAALKNEPLFVFDDGLQTRDFTYITDTVNAAIHLAAKETGTFDLGTGHETTIIDLAKTIIDLAGSNSKIILKKPNKLRQPFEVRQRRADTTLINNLGISCNTSLQTGLTELLKFLNNNIEISTSEK